MKKAIGILLVCLLVLSAFFLGRSLGSGETATEDGLSKRNLRLSATTTGMSRTRSSRWSRGISRKPTTGA